MAQSLQEATRNIASTLVALACARQDSPSQLPRILIYFCDQYKTEFLGGVENGKTKEDQMETKEGMIADLVYFEPNMDPALLSFSNESKHFLKKLFLFEIELKQFLLPS
jgi:hypothetical protein